MSAIAQKGLEQIASLKIDDDPSEFEFCDESECSVCLKEAEERSISMNPSSGVASKTSNGFKVDPDLERMIAESPKEKASPEVLIDEIISQLSRKQRNSQGSAFARQISQPSSKKLNSVLSGLADKENNISRASAPKAVSVASSKRKPKRKLIVDYSREMLTLDKLQRESSSKKRRFAEITNDVPQENREKSDADALTELFGKQMTIAAPEQNNN